MTRTPTESGNGILLTPIADLGSSALRTFSTSDVPVSDLSYIVGPAMAMATHCMAPALGQLAFTALDGPMTAAGWNIAASANATRNVIDLRLSRPDQPGAWHLGVVFDPVPTPAESARLAQQDADDTARYATMTPDEITDDMISDILSEKTDPANIACYRHALATDRVTRIKGTALCVPAGRDDMMAGPPLRIEKDDTRNLGNDIRPDDQDGMDIWWSGIALDVPPVRIIEDGMKFEKGRSDEFTGVELLAVLSDIITEMGLAKNVWQRVRDLQDVAFWSSDVGNTPDCEELAYSLVDARNGLLDQGAIDMIAQFTSKALANDLHRHRDGTVALAKRLTESGFTGPDATYDDGRRQVWAEETGSADVLHIETQNGTYRMEMGFLDTQAWVVGETDTLVGTFMTAGDVTVPMWAPLFDPDKVVYASRNVRDMNGILQSVHALARCFDEDHPKAVDDDATPTF